MARKQREDRNKARGAAAHLEDAQQEADRAEEAARLADEAAKESEAKVAGLEKKAEAAEKEARELEKQLEQAVEGSAEYERLLKAAKAAREKANDAAGELGAEKVK